MPKFPLYLLALVMLAILSSACGVYQKHGHGWLANSRLEDPTPVLLPADAPSISQRYRPLPAGQSGEHKGFDILLPQGTPVLAAADGEVARAELSLLFGRQLMLNHGWSDRGYRLQTRYFHLSERLVGEGERVRRGQIIAYSGASGMAGVFPHLHFEVHRLDDADSPRAFKFVDPQLFWVDGAGRVTCFESAREYAPTPVRLTYPAPCRGRDWQ